MGQREALVNLFFGVGPLVIGFFLALFAALGFDRPLVLGWLALSLYGLGLALFLVAKSSFLRAGVRLSFGSARMSPWNRRAYRAGYALMAVGLVATVVLVAATGAA